MWRTRLIVATLIASVFPSVASSSAQTLAEITLGNLEFALSVFKDPETDATFHTPAWVMIGPDRRSYWFDSGDVDVKVFDENRELLYTVGGGQVGSPGYVANVLGLDLDDDGTLYVLDPRRGLATFDKNGEFVRLLRFPGNSPYVRSFVVLGNDMVVAAIHSLSEQYFGFAAHRFALDDEGLHYVAPVSPLPDIAPGLYRQLAYTKVWEDEDDEHFLLTSVTRHHVRKYNRDGQLIWEVQDDSVFPDVRDLLAIAPSGNVRVLPSPRSVSLVTLNEDFYMHTITVPDPRLAELTARLTGVTNMPADMRSTRIIELIERRRPTGSTRYEVPHAFTVTGSDVPAGLVYGTYSDDPVPVVVRVSSINR